MVFFALGPLIQIHEHGDEGGLAICRGHRVYLIIERLDGRNDFFL